VDLKQALKESCDVYFYQLGQRLGIERIADYARRFGLGQVTGVDVDGEKKGLVPDSAWSLRVRKTAWYPGETISVAIGQGPLLVTPLQIAVAFSVVANGGRLVTPHLVLHQDHPPPQVAVRDQETLRRIRDALWSVVNSDGTGANARVEGLDIAGKTGTVQVVAQETWIDSDDLPFELRDHAWFASFAPAADPRLTVVVFVEHGGKGSRAAAPIARTLYEAALRIGLAGRDL
jgi:penicillin-binding protein 2